MPQAFFAFIVAAAKKIIVDLVIAAVINYAVGELVKQSQKRPVGYAPIKQSTPPVHRAYGHGRKPGAFLLYESVPKHTLDVLAFCEGRCGSNVEHFFHDDRITTKVSGETNQTDGHYGGPIFIQTNNGEPGQAALSIITAVAGVLWTAAHKGGGTVLAGVRCQMVSEEKMQRIYPYGEVEYSQARDWLCVYDWRKDSTAGGSGAHRRDNPATWEYSPNPVVCWVHDKWACQGYDWTRRFSRILDLLTAEANACEVMIPTLAGPSVRRYDAFVWYDEHGDPKETDDRFIRATDGWMTELGDGSLLFRVGRAVVSPFTITDDVILDYSWIGGIPTSRRINEVQPRYLVPELIYELAPAPAFIDPAHQADHGPLPTLLDLEEVTNISQCMRLAKSKFSEVNAFYTGTWTLDLDALPSDFFTHRFHNVAIPDAQSSLADTVVEFLKPQVNLLERTVTAQVREVDLSRYSWTAAEEGGGVPIVDGGGSTTPAAPEAYSIIAFEGSIGSATGMRLRIVFVEAYDPDVSYGVRVRLAGDSVWTVGGLQEPVDAGGHPMIETGFVPSDELEVQFQAARTSGVSDWGPEPPDYGDARYTAPIPGPTTAFTADGSLSLSGMFDFSCMAPADASLHHVRVIAGPVGGGTGLATSAGVFFAASGEFVSGTVVDMLPGTYDTWAIAENVSNQGSAPDGPVTVTVT